MREFVYTGLPGRVVFGLGALRHLERELDLLGVKRVLVLSTAEKASQAEELSVRLGARSAGVCARAVMHVPVAVAREGVAAARNSGADCTLAVGGGSTTGLAKAIALETGFPIVAVPTTYAGSEMTPIQGFTDGGLKRTQRDAKMLPRVVIYDPSLTVSLPRGLSATSGLNAIAHAAEGLYAQDNNPIMNLVAEEGIRALAEGLPKVLGDPADLEGRGECQYGAWLCGMVLGSVGMALHHKLCHTLGGSFDLPHAETHSVVLPYALAYNSAAAPQAMLRIARALGTASAATGVYDLARRLDAPASLAALGLREADLDRAADLATQSPYWNPRPLDRGALRALLDDAYRGRPPAD